MSDTKLIDKFAAGYDRLVAALNELPREMWHYKPSPQAWSVHEIIIHMPDSEASGFVRCRKIIAEPGVTVAEYDQDAFANNCRYTERDLDMALALFRAQRASSTELLRSLDETTWDNYVEHPCDGRVTLRDWLVVYEAHVTKHIGQMQRNLAHWEAAGRE